MINSGYCDVKNYLWGMVVLKGNLKTKMGLKVQVQPELPVPLSSPYGGLKDTHGS
jgi:hypothetical protein